MTTSAASAAKLDTFVTRFLIAKAASEDSPIGPKVDAANARMERIMAQAEKAGLGDALVKALGY